jgi:hypothetical protein
LDDDKPLDDDEELVPLRGVGLADVAAAAASPARPAMQRRSKMLVPR